MEKSVGHTAACSLVPTLTAAGVASKEPKVQAWRESKR
jgi:hypothetical protein